ncbi:uncharacterized protein LOC108607976 [Drosophila busckii]|uniref:uncharacterized protein LOC108607976 n=1 Tax=Drosophila busckii TaxID=30019 RepID=UPI00083F3728|nr:uncharacterized protein LOC108607976 [Drosophila busckii]
MKLLLAALLGFWIFALTDSGRYRPNGACLVYNKYKHERSCKGPRRKFYAFHRIILNCVSVFSKCKRMHKNNEFSTLKKCHRECGWHMKIEGIKSPVNGNSSSSSSSSSSSGGGS